MIFLRNEKFGEYLRLYPANSILLAVNLLVFLAMLAASGGRPSPEVAIRFGAMSDMAPYAAQHWRWIASMFVHFGFRHILFNAFALYVFAPPLERLIGSFRYACLYLLGGLAGNLLTAYLLRHELYTSAGASGAIFAVYGAYIFIGLFQPRRLDDHSRKIVYILLGVALIYSVADQHVNLWAHLGGLAAGFLLLPLIGRRNKQDK